MPDNRTGFRAPLGWRTAVGAVLVILAEAWLTTQKAWHHQNHHHKVIACIVVAAGVVVIWGVLANVFRRRQPQNGRQRSSWTATANNWERTR